MNIQENDMTDIVVKALNELSKNGIKNGSWIEINPNVRIEAIAVAILHAIYNAPFKIFMGMLRELF